MTEGRCSGRGSHRGRSSREGRLSSGKEAALVALFISSAILCFAPPAWARASDGIDRSGDVVVDASSDDDPIEGTVDQVDDPTGGTVEQVEGTVEGTVDEVEGTVQGTVDEVEGTVQGTVDEVESTVEGTVDEVADAAGDPEDTVEEIVEDAEEAVGSVLDEADDVVDEVQGGSSAPPGDPGSNAADEERGARSSDRDRAPGTPTDGGGRAPRASDDPLVAIGVPAGDDGEASSLDGGGASTPEQDAAAASPIEVLERIGFPIALAVIVTLFVLVHDRVDRKDPKLADAPLDPTQGSIAFR